MKKTTINVSNGIGVIFAVLFIAGIFTVYSCSKDKGKVGGDGDSFTMLVDYDYSLENMAWPPIIEEATGVHVDYMLFPYAAAVERKNILISSGDYPDVIGGWILTESDIMQLGMKDGVLIPLEDLIKKHAPNIQEALDLPGVREQMTLPDGHIYTLPYPIGEPIVSFNPWVNQKWLDQLGLKMPTTTEELREVLIAFRDKIPPVNGQKIIPFSGDPENMNLGMLAGWWGVNAGITANNSGGMAIVDGKLQITITRDELKECIKYFAGLYKEGLIDREIFTQDQTTWKAKGKLGLYGVNIGYGPGDWLPDPREADPTIDISTERYGWSPVPVLKAPGSAKPVYRRNGFGITLFRAQVAITDRATNPETIIKWWNWIYSPEHSAEAQAALIGLGIEEFEGKFYELDRTNWTNEMNEKWGWNKYWIASLPKFIRGGKILPSRTSVTEYPYGDNRDALYEPYLETEPVPAMWIAGEDAAKAADITLNIQNYVKQKQAEWISGQTSIDAEWDAYKAQLDKLGIQDLLKMKQTALGK
ncbi:MAG: ABC transporter substrate-binding protein [Treponemataceae bacterium]|nr:MAG: ABC transporter substrate-binding protein [Treponemataceae bacterium]